MSKVCGLATLRGHIKFDGIANRWRNTALRNRAKPIKVSILLKMLFNVLKITSVRVEKKIEPYLIKADLVSAADDSNMILFGKR